MLILGNSFQGLEDLFNGIASLLMLLFFLALLVAIVFGGVISTLVGSIIGSALNPHPCGAGIRPADRSR